VRRIDIVLLGRLGLRVRPGPRRQAELVSEQRLLVVVRAVIVAAAIERLAGLVVLRLDLQDIRLDEHDAPVGAAERQYRQLVLVRTRLEDRALLRLHRGAGQAVELERAARRGALRMDCGCGQPVAAPSNCPIGEARARAKG